MSRKRIKIQLTLPKDLVEKIEKETSENFTNMSLWFEKVIRQYFDENSKATNETKKKLLELDI
jgi:metal-responsive CopG/Arc/MetJ family transcriptional regulator